MTPMRRNKCLNWSITEKAGDSIGSTVESRIFNVPIGVGEPWFEGLEPALARALMAIPGARGWNLAGKRCGHNAGF